MAFYEQRNVNFGESGPFRKKGNNKPFVAFADFSAVLSVTGWLTIKRAGLLNEKLSWPTTEQILIIFGMGTTFWSGMFIFVG